MSDENKGTMRELEGPEPTLATSGSLYRLLEHADRLEINVTLTEYDKPTHDPATWSDAIKSKIREGEDGYFARFPGRRILCVSHAVHERRCIKILHLGPKP